MKRIWIAACAAIVLSLASISSLQAQTQDGPNVTSAWLHSGMSWNRGAKLLVRYMPMNFDGKLGFCVAYVGNGGAQARKFHRAALDEARILMDGSTVMRNLRFGRAMSSAHMQTGGVGQPSKCKATRADFPNQASLSTLRLQFRVGQYKVEK